MSEMGLLQPTDLPDDAVMVDVRELDEWTAGHAPNAIHIPMGELPARVGELPEDEPLPLICRSGNRSGRVGEWLAAQGYVVANVDGGMKQWAADGKPVVADGGAGTVI